MADRNLRLRLGLFVAAAVGVLAALVVLFGGAPSLLSAHTKYTIVYPEAPGVGVGTPVRKSGVRIGEVSLIDLDPDTGDVRVHVLVDPKYRPRPSEDATITRGLLSGDTTIDFLPKEGDDRKPVPRADPYPPGATIVGVAPINTRALVNRATAVIPTAQESLIGLQQSFARLEQAIPKAERAFDEIAGLARAGREMVPELRETNHKVQELIGSADPPVPAVPLDRVVAQVPPLAPPAVPPAAPRAAPPAAEPPTVRLALGEIIALLRELRPAAEDIQTLIRGDGRELARTARSVRAAADNVADLLNADNRKAAAATLRNLQAASDDLTRTIRLAAILLDQGERTVRELNARLTQSERLLTNLEKASGPLADNAGPIVDDVAAAVKNINVAADQLAKVLTDVREAVRQANRGDGTVQKLLADPSLFNNLNEAAFSASRLLARAEKIARDLEVFSDKIARRPETLGLGGAVRPSTGLKEAPTAPLGPVPFPPVAPLPGGAVQPPAPVVPIDAPRPIPPVPGGAMQLPAYRPTSDRGDLPPR